MKIIDVPINEYMKSICGESRITWDEFVDIMRIAYGCEYSREKKAFGRMYNGKFQVMDRTMVERIAAVHGYYDSLEGYIK